MDSSSAAEFESARRKAFKTVTTHIAYCTAAHRILHIYHLLSVKSGWERGTEIVEDLSVRQILCFYAYVREFRRIFTLHSLHFIALYVIKKSLFRYAAHSREKHAESHNTAPNDKYVQRNPVQFVVTQLTISCPN